MERYGAVGGHAELSLFETKGAGRTLMNEEI